MLKDADHSYFAGVYIICGYTDLRFGIDSLAAIIERRFHMHLFVPNTLFLLCGRSSTRIKGLLWEGDGFLLLTSAWNPVISHGRVLPQNSDPYQQNSSTG